MALKRMERGNITKQQLFVYAFVGLFFFSMIATVSAELFYETILGTNWTLPYFSEEVNLTISYWIIAAIFFFLIFDVVGFLPFWNNNIFIKLLVSAGVTFLSFAFMDPIWLRATLKQYEALGIALSSIIPLMILLVFVWNIQTAKWDKRKGRVAINPGMANIISIIVMGTFGIYLVISLLTLEVSSDPLQNTLFASFYGIAIVAVILHFVIGNWAYRKAYEYMREARDDTAEEVARDAGASVHHLSRAGEEFNEGAEEGHN
jgi:hypothetical protein